MRHVRDGRLEFCLSLFSAKPQGAIMDLDNRQTRLLFLAGTVSLPTPFPSVGTISFGLGSLTNSPGRKTDSKPVVVVQDRSDRAWTRTHSMLLEHVATVFIP